MLLLFVKLSKGEKLIYDIKNITIKGLNKEFLVNSTLVH